MSPALHLPDTFCHPLFVSWLYRLRVVLPAFTSQPPARRQ
nr:MAG TPA: hypothetical protein [Caudoviricetes sp.]